MITKVSSVPGFVGVGRKSDSLFTSAISVPLYSSIEIHLRRKLVSLSKKYIVSIYFGEES